PSTRVGTLKYHTLTMAPSLVRTVVARENRAASDVPCRLVDSVLSSPSRPHWEPHRVHARRSRPILLPRLGPRCPGALGTARPRTGLRGGGPASGRKGLPGPPPAFLAVDPGGSKPVVAGWFVWNPSAEPLRQLDDDHRIGVAAGACARASKARVT